MARPSPLTPDFDWNEDAGRYFDNRTGRFVSGETLRSALDDYLDAKMAQARDLAQQLQRREISIADWQEALEDTLAKIHLASAALAKGGWAQMDFADWGAVGAQCRIQYGYLRDFAIDIENGLPLDGRFLRRVEMYIAAGRHTYYRRLRVEMEGRGADEERSVRSARDSCQGCVDAAAADWQPLGTLPLPGARQCLSNCRCHMTYRDSTTGRVL